MRGLPGSAQEGREPTPRGRPPSCREYHERVHSQGQQLQQLQAELDKLHKEVSSVRAANSEVSPVASACPARRPVARATSQSGSTSEAP